VTSMASSESGDATAGEETRRRVHIVPHTHWDREWYASFQTFRLRLVDLLDDLLPRMEGDPAYARFLLDGQLAVVEDYLAVRPGEAERLRRLVGSGRIAVGPWYTLPDEFLIGGETLIRNLQLGLRVGDRFGGAMPVGYLPDMFGHVAQMPQILAQFGFEHAVVWRGVPSAVDRSGFWWEAPDGTTVRAEYMPQGYGNGSALPDDAKVFVRAVAGFAEEWSDLITGPVLWMNGTDHQMPQPWLGRVVAEANDIQDEYELRIVSLTEHLAAAPTDGLPTWRGELRSGARANLLMGVVSNRVDVRAASARAERALLAGAEPLSALFLPPERWPGALLDEAWRAVVLNAAHDSVCACSIDDVCDAVLTRYREAADIGEGLADRALAQLSARVDHEGPVVVNPTARPRGGLVEVTVPGTVAPAGTQRLRARRSESLLHSGPPEIVIPAAQEVDWIPTVTAFAVEAEDGAVLVANERKGTEQLVSAEVRAALDALRTGHHGQLRLTVRQPEQVTVLAHVADVPGFGWRGWSPDDASGATPVTVSEPGAATGGEGPVLANGLVTVAVDPADGTFALDGHTGLGRLVDGGDCGDTYNWCPPATDTVVDEPEAVDVRVLDRGPLRARVLVAARYRWPAGREGLDRRTDATVDHGVRTVLELRAGEAFVRVEVSLDNASRDHRLRAHFPLPSPAAGTRAECAFGTVDRGPEAEGGPTEAPLATYPAQRFVRAGGLTVVHDAVTEHELVAPTELAVTLLRATGMLSQVPMVTRPLPAGPLVPTPGAQMLGPVTRRYAVAAGDVDPYALADEVLVPLRVAGPAAGRGTTVAEDAGPPPDLPPVGAGLTVTGAEVSAVTREGDALVVRVFNPGDEPATVAIEGRRGWLVDLRGRPLLAFEGGFDLRPRGLATAVVTGR
jgi:mannosylglycerate hydrolase